MSLCPLFHDQSLNWVNWLPWIAFSIGSKINIIAQLTNECSRETETHPSSDCSHSHNQGQSWTAGKVCLLAPMPFWLGILDPPPQHAGFWIKFLLLGKRNMNITHLLCVFYYHLHYFQLLHTTNPQVSAGTNRCC